jgi:DNA-binding transcriptional LysR family regulator
LQDLGLARIKAFLVVAEELSFTRAAARLHVAQQALSASVRRFERDVGVRLFDRSTRAVGLTPAGHAMVRRCRHALDELSRGVADARRADRQGRGTLAVGIMAGAALELTEPILARFAKRCPDATIKLDPHIYDDPSAGLRAGTSDVAVLRLPLELRGLETCHLFTEPRVAAMATHHPLARRRSLTLDDLRATTVVRPASPDPIWNEFWGAGCPTIIEARTLEVALERISAGEAVGITTAGWARFYPRPGVHNTAVAALAPSQVALGWRKGETNPWVSPFVDSALATVAANPTLRQAIEHPRPPRRRRR